MTVQRRSEVKQMEKVIRVNKPEILDEKKQQTVQSGNQFSGGSETNLNIL